MILSDESYRRLGLLPAIHRGKSVWRVERPARRWKLTALHGMLERAATICRNHWEVATEDSHELGSRRR